MLVVYVKNSRSPVKVERKGARDMKLFIENFSITGSKAELEMIARMISDNSAAIERDDKRV